MNRQQSGYIVHKKYLHIYQCRPGDVLADDVYDCSGILVMAKNTVLNDHAMNRLKMFRIRQLSVYELQKG